MFEGFFQETVDFMWGIRFNNERSWFMDHKEQYQRSFLEPIRALGTELQAGLADRFPEQPLELKVSRIYRDARRLFGRGPYKDHLWLSLFQGDDQTDAGARPVLWFELKPDGWSSGMGFWCAKAVTMEKFRARMDRDPEPMLQLDRALRRRPELALEGPEYARGKTPSRPELAAWYNKKSLTVGRDEPLTELIFTPELKTLVLEDFTFLMPYYQYFATLWADPDPRENR